jgi:hypothetical protein
MARTGRKPKYDYRSREFLDRIEELAEKGLTDREIALSVRLSPAFFGEKKAELTELSEVLMRARGRLNTVVREKYLAIGLGGIRTKTVVRRKIEMEDGTVTEGDVMQETETELPPNPNVLQTWLFHHDPEWHKTVIDSKRLDVTTNGGDISATQLIFSPTPLSVKDMEDIKKLQHGGKENSADAGISET